MVEIADEELVRLGEGPCHVGNKLYVPKTVMEYLKLAPKDKVEYSLILDPKYRDLIVIKKQKKT